MSLGHLPDVASSGIPGLDAALTLVQATETSIDNVKIYRKQCRDLNRRCEELISSLKEGSVGLEGQSAMALVDEATAVLARMNRQVAEWAALNRIRSFLQQREIKEGITRFHQDLDAIFVQVNLRMNVELSRDQLATRQHQERDKAELRDLLGNIIRNNDDMKTLLDMYSSPESPHPVVQVMESLQMELQHPDLESDELKSFKRGLWALHENTQELPPLEDLTGQITMTSEWPVAKGATSDVYKGKWLDREDVALRLLRFPTNSPTIQKRFEREVRILRGLSHPNIVPLLGAVYLKELMYSVSLWMENGTAILYVNKTPHVDRVQLLSQVAEGLQYLHENGILHGDLRGANILIDGSGNARLSNFGLAKFLEDYGDGPLTNPRWTAPELVHDTGALVPSSDVWSLGMTALEILTGEKPFKEISRDVNVVLEVYRGSTPKRPPGDALTDGISDALWTLMNDCWHKRPEERPSAKVIRQRLEVIRQESVRGQQLLRSVEHQSSGTTLVPGHQRRISLLSRKWPRRVDSSSSEISTNDRSGTDEKEDNFSISPFSIASSYSIEGSRASSGSTSHLRSLPRHSEQLLDQSFKDLALRSAVTSQAKKPPDSIQSTISYDLSTSGPLSSAPLKSLARSVLLRSNESRILSNSSPLSPVVAGTLEELVDRLIEGIALPSDSKFRDVFLNTHSAFTTSEDVLTMITSRFEDAYEESSVETRVQVHMNILNVFRHWLSSSYIRVEPELLSLMKEFCLSVLPRMTASVMTEKLQDILRIIDRHQQANDAPPVPSSLEQKIPKSSDITPRDLAIGLGLLEGDSLKSILPSDYLAHLSGRPSRVNGAADLNMKIMTWVKKSILRYSEMERRAEVLKFFAYAGQECRKLRNFSSLAAIASALQSSPVVRLQRTRESLPSRVKSVIAEVQGILDPTSNHAAYRNAIKASVEPNDQDRCIPWMAVHLEDLRTVLEAEPAVITHDGLSLINFQRYVRFMDQAKELLHFLPPDLERYRSDGKVAYVDGQLRSIQFGQQVDEALVQRSQDLEVEENRYLHRRTAELKSLGFSVRSKAVHSPAPRPERERPPSEAQTETEVTTIESLDSLSPVERMDGREVLNISGQEGRHLRRSASAGGIEAGTALDEVTPMEPMDFEANGALFVIFWPRSSTSDNKSEDNAKPNENLTRHNDPSVAISSSEPRDPNFLWDGCSCSIHEPILTQLWLDSHGNNATIVMIRKSSTIDGPFPSLLSFRQEALSIFTKLDSSTVEIASSLATASGFPVLIRRPADNPAPHLPFSKMSQMSGTTTQTSSQGGSAAGSGSNGNVPDNSGGQSKKGKGKEHSRDDDGDEDLQQPPSDNTASPPPDSPEDTTIIHTTDLRFTDEKDNFNVIIQSSYYPVPNKGEQGLVGTNTPYILGKFRLRVRPGPAVFVDRAVGSMGFFTRGGGEFLQVENFVSLGYDVPQKTYKTITNRQAAHQGSAKASVSPGNPKVQAEYSYTRTEGRTLEQADGNPAPLWVVRPEHPNLEPSDDGSTLLQINALISRHDPSGTRGGRDRVGEALDVEYGMSVTVGSPVASSPGVSSVYQHQIHLWGGTSSRPIGKIVLTSHVLRDIYTKKTQFMRFFTPAYSCEPAKQTNVQFDGAFAGASTTHTPAPKLPWYHKLLAAGGSRPSEPSGPSEALKTQNIAALGWDYSNSRWYRPIWPRLSSNLEPLHGNDGKNTWKLSWEHKVNEGKRDDGREGPPATVAGTSPPAKSSTRG